MKMKRSVAVSFFLLAFIAACQHQPERNQACDGECSGRGGFLYTIDGHPCPLFAPWDEVRAAAEEAAKREARIDAAMNCRKRSGNHCTCAFGRLAVGEDTKFEAYEGPYSFTDIPRPVCVIIVNFAYEGGACSGTQIFIDRTPPNASCSGTMTQGGHGVVTANPPCPQPCDPAMLDLAHEAADADAERKSIAACQALSDANCLSVGGTKIDIGGRCYGNTVPGEPAVCVSEYYSGLRNSVCAFVP
jgi:hypothetical protein